MFLLPETHPGPDPGRPLLLEDGRGWTLAQLRAAVADVAELLRRPEKQVAFCLCQNDARTVVAYLAAVEAGCATLLLDASLATELQSALVDRYRPELLLGAPAEKGTALEGFVEVEAPHGVEIRRRISGFADIGPHPDLALLLSTSGSTGSPKLVRLGRESVEHNARMIARALEIDAGERPITSLPLHYSYGLSVLNSHLLRGATVVLTGESLTSKGFWETFRRERCTSMAGVPYSYQMLRRLDLDKLDVPSLTTLTQAGGKLDPPLIEHFARLMARRAGRLYVMYGQTEATARISVLPAGLVLEKLGSAGQALPEGELRVEVDGAAVAAGQVGEVVYRGANVMLGYAETRADLARGDDLGGELRTGDLGYLDEDGVLFLTGRSKRIAKVFGLRINLEDVEGLLREHGGTAVVGGADQLLIYCEHGDEASFAAHRRHLGERFKIHHTAFVFTRVETLPRNASGKIDYPRLRRPE